MDDQIFQAMLGTVMPVGGPPSSAMANELRGQRDLGQFLSIAPGLEKVGQDMQTGALAQAKQIGDRRQQGLTRTRQAMMDERAANQTTYDRNRNTMLDELKAEKTDYTRNRDANQTTYDRNRDTELDRLKAEETDYTRKRDTEALELEADILEYERAGWTDIEERLDPEGNVALYGLMDGRGALQKIPGSDGLKKRDSYVDRMAAKKAAGSPKRLNIEGTNLEYLRYPNGMIVYGTQEYPSMAAFAAARPDILTEGNAAQADERYAIEHAGELATGKAKEVTDLRTNASQANASYTNSMGNLQGMLYQLEQGANTGQIFEWFPTLTNATSMYQSLVSAETLALLNKYQLKPVSDADMKVLKSVASPGMDSAAMKEWATNKIEVLKRAQASNQVFEDWVRANDKVPSGKERDQLKADMAAAANAAAPNPGGVNTSGADADPTEVEVNAIAQERAALQAELDALTGQSPPATALPKTINAQGVP